MNAMQCIVIRLYSSIALKSRHVSFAGIIAHYMLQRSTDLRRIRGEEGWGGGS